MIPDLPAQVTALIVDHVYAQGKPWTSEFGSQSPLHRLKVFSRCSKSIRKALLPFLFSKTSLVIKSQDVLNQLRVRSSAVLPVVTSIKLKDTGYLQSDDLIHLLTVSSKLEQLTIDFAGSQPCFRRFNAMEEALGSATNLANITKLTLNVQTSLSCITVKAFVEAFRSLESLEIDTTPSTSYRGDSTTLLQADVTSVGINNPSLRTVKLKGPLLLPCNCKDGSLLNMFSSEGLTPIDDLTVPTIAHFAPAHQDNHLVVPNLERLTFTSIDLKMSGYEALASYAPALKFLDISSWDAMDDVKLAQRLSTMPNTAEELKVHTRPDDIIEFSKLSPDELDTVFRGKALRKIGIVPFEDNVRDAETYYYSRRLFRDSLAARNIQVEMK